MEHQTELLSKSAERRELRIHGVVHQSGGDGYQRLRLRTTAGEIELQHYPVSGASAGAVFVGGIGGGWDSPNRGRLYSDLCADLVAAGISALRVRFRDPTRLEEATLDVLAGVRFLRREGVQAVALTGHSLGGAVVVQAAARSPMVRAVVTLSTQAHGLDAVTRLPEGCASLFLHGDEDEILTPDCSRYAYHLAPDPKRIRLLAGARHGLEEAADEVRGEVRRWIIDHLRRAEVERSEQG